MVIGVHSYPPSPRLRAGVTQWSFPSRPKIDLGQSTVSGPHCQKVRHTVSRCRGTEFRRVWSNPRHRCSDPSGSTQETGPRVTRRSAHSPVPEKSDESTLSEDPQAQGSPPTAPLSTLGPDPKRPREGLGSPGSPFGSEGWGTLEGTPTKEGSQRGRSEEPVSGHTVEGRGNVQDVTFVQDTGTTRCVTQEGRVRRRTESDVRVGQRGGPWKRLGLSMQTSSLAGCCSGGVRCRTWHVE